MTALPSPNMTRCIVLALGFVVAMGAAQAGGLPKYGANCEALSQTVGQTGDWLGHFTGGRFVRVAPGYSQVDWQDQFACFPTRLDCSRWQAAQRQSFNQIEGYKTCLPLR